MKFQKALVYILSGMLLAAALFFYNEDPLKAPPFSFVVVTEEGEENIHYWENDAGEYLVFLPSYTNTKGLQLRSSTEHFQIGDMILSDGMDCGDMKTEVEYPLCYTVGGSTFRSSITFLQSRNIPTLHIDVDSGTMEAIHGKKSNQEAGNMRLYQQDGSLNAAGKIESISCRGNTTFRFAEKKPYNITLAAEQNLLEMGAAKKWILLANAFDPTHIRNKLVFDFADEAGLPFSPDSEWVDVYLNGEYAGLYLLSERNEIHPQRVDIPEKGSFLVSKENQWRLDSQHIPYITTENDVFLRIHASSLDRTILEQTFQSAENAILAEEGIDPDTGKHWEELIDLDSWVKKYLVEEIFGGMDAGILSQFFYADGNEKNGKIYAGPVWDYDVSMGSPNGYAVHAPNMLYANCPGKLGSPWFCALYQKEPFLDSLKETYQNELRPLLLNYREETILRYEEKIAQSAWLNQIRWNTSDYTSQMEFVKTYLQERMAFLDTIWIENQPYNLVVVKLPERTFSYAVAPGESLPELPTFENTPDTIYHGWFDSDTDEPFDLTQPIKCETEIYLKSETIPEHNAMLIHYVLPAVMLIFTVIFLMTDIRRTHKNRNPEKKMRETEKKA